MTTSPPTLDDVLPHFREVVRTTPPGTGLVVAVRNLGLLLAEIDRLTPRVITTAEAAALPEGSVVIDRDGDAWTKRAGLWFMGIGVYFADLHGPLTVVHIPTEEARRG